MGPLVVPVEAAGRWLRERPGRTSQHGVGRAPGSAEAPCGPRGGVSTLAECPLPSSKELGRGLVSCSEAAAGLGNSPKKGLGTLKSSQPHARGTLTSCCLAPRAAGRDAL